MDGRDTINVDGAIEDLAGNRLGKLFGVDAEDLAEPSFTVSAADLSPSPAPLIGPGPALPLPRG